MEGKADNTVWFEKIEELFSVELKETNLHISKLQELANKVSAMREPTLTEDIAGVMIKDDIGDGYASRLLSLHSLLSAYNGNLANIVNHLSEFI